MAGKRKNRKLNGALIVLLIIYLAALVYFMFFSEEYGRTEVSADFVYNIHPFQEIRRYIEYRSVIGTTSVIINLLGNIVAFMPFGFLVPIISPKERRVFMIFLLTVLLSLTIEVVQLFSHVGSFDVDDLILNTIGGLSGYAVYSLFRSWGKSIAN